MIMYIAIKRSAQAVLHCTDLSREEANQIGEQIAARLSQPEAYERARMRYKADDEFEVGEMAARDYLGLL